MPIRCQQLHIDEVTGVFPCQVMHFPCPYLGLPLSYKRPSRAALQPVLDKIINRCPTWKANLMAKQGRLILIKTVLVSIPVHHSIALELPDWFLKAYEQRLRAFFWQGSEKVHGGHCMVAWETVCRPVWYGGLGIPNLKIMGWALRLRWLWLRSSPDSSWAALPSSPDLALEGFFAASTIMKVGNGDTARFWVDRWLDGQSVRAIAPHLFAAVDAAIIGVHSVRQALAGNAWVRDVTGVLTVPVISELLLLHNQLASLPPLCGFDDRLVWKWTTDGVYTTASAYKALFLGLESFACGKIVWKA